MEILNDYLNNFETILEIGKLDEILFSEGSFVDKEIFLSEVKIYANQNFTDSGNPTLNEDQFKESLYVAKLKTVQNAIEQLVNKKVIKEIRNQDGTISYQINDEENFPDWLKDFLKE
jgi:hypothetical protein